MHETHEVLHLTFSFHGCNGTPPPLNDVSELVAWRATDFPYTHVNTCPWVVICVPSQIAMVLDHKMRHIS